MRLYDVFNAKEIEKLQLTIPDEGLIRRVGHTVVILFMKGSLVKRLFDTE
ncbi:MAG: hypothetical protein CM15mP70_17430 [Pelagibacteraceae bacterium]|nr:MAG: hypothetical protein CM15mP70_17430 [Pelagibacteraceae bacterium]